MNDLMWPWDTVDPSPYSWSDFPIDGQINPTKAKEVMHPDLITALKNFYNETKIKLHFTSAYRSPAYNVGIGVEESAHCSGIAVDSDYGTMNGQQLGAWQIFDFIAQKAYQRSNRLFSKLYYFNTATYYPNSNHLHLDMKYHWKCALSATRLGICYYDNTWNTFCATELCRPISTGAQMYVALRGGQPPIEEPQYAQISTWTWIASGLSLGLLAFVVTRRSNAK